MGLAFRKIKVYSKLVLVAFAAIIVCLIFVKNRANKADVWLFKQYTEVPTLWLMLLTSVAAVAAWWLIWSLRRLARDWRQLRKDEEFDAKLAEQRRLAQELADREKRIGEKLRDPDAE